MNLLPFILFLCGLFLALLCYSLKLKYEYEDIYEIFVIRLAFIVFGILGVISSIAGFIWTDVVLYHRVRSLIARPPYTPELNVTYPRIAITALVSLVLLWCLTRPHPSDLTFDSEGPIPMVPKGAPVVIIPYARYVSYFLIVALAICGVLINWTYTFVKALYIAIPVEIFAMAYLARGEVWHTSGKYSRHRYRHVFGPFSRLVYFPFCFIVAWLYGCSVVGFLLLLCSK